MTDTPVDPQDVVIKPPPATVYAKANVPIGIVMTVRGTVEKLTADGASDQAIVEAIRQESPELAEVVEANTPKRPQGIDAHEWIRTILAVYMAILVTYATLRAEASPPSVEEIARIVEDVLSKQRPAPPP